MNRTIWTYVLITYLITWSITLYCYYCYKSGSITLDQLNLLYNAGALGPFVSAIICARKYYGVTGVQKLLSTFNLRTFNKKSLLISFSPVPLFINGLLIFPMFTGHFYTFSDTQKQFYLTSTISCLGWFLPLITYAFFEEFGWRGFLLPHLQEKYSALRSTFILTILWACWHLPFFLWRFQFSPFIIFGFFFSIFMGAVILTSAFNFSKGSIVSTILFHLLNNIASALDKEYIVAVVSTGIIFIAFYIIWKYKANNLSEHSKVKNFYL